MHYQNKRVLLASKHEKERAIRPAFLNKLGCEIYTSNFDTDQFGTFTGEIPRAHSAYETCVLKAKSAAIAADCSFSIASEGSFGPHPSLPFFASDHEIMVFVDLENDWIIADQLLTPKTNYKMLTLDADTEIDSFLESVQFPSHAVTLQVPHTKEILGKGIQELALLKQLITTGFSKGDQLLLATDMRAMMNPTRMEALSLLAEKLAVRISTCCPACCTPGFGFISTADYLSCSVCDGPTTMHRFEIWGCISCDMKEKKPRHDNLEEAEPTYCNYCNP